MIRDRVKTAATIFEEHHRIPCGIVSHGVQTNRTESRISVSNSREMATANLRRLTLRTAKGCGETFIETDTYLNLGGVLYSFVTLKDLADATSRAILRELMALDFPIVCNAQITVPDQAKVLKGYKSRLRKMQAAQRDANGGRRINVEAQVAEAQVVRVKQDIILIGRSCARIPA